VLIFLLRGFAAGALTGVPIGPVNVAVIDASYRYTLRRAIAVGFGGACADFLYSALALLAVTPVLLASPSVPPILYGVSGIVLMVYGFITARSQLVKPSHAPDSVEAKLANEREVWNGFKSGVLLIVLNPAAIVTWVVIAGSVLPPATRPEGLFCAFGVFVGSFGWFALVAYLTQKGKHVLGDKAAWIPRVIGVALMIYAVWLIGKAVHFLIA
jgi:threonine/homoserine/homoserine lactone efflux protein